MSFVLGAAAFSTATAQTAVTASASGLLYEITGNGLKNPSYLFGTMHLICEKDMFASEKMQTYIERTGQVILEANTGDPAVAQKVAKLSMIEGGKKIKNYLTPEEYSRLDEVYKSYHGYFV